MLRTRTLAATLVAASALALTACGSDSLSSGDSSSSATPSTSESVDQALVATLPAKVKSAGKIVIGTDSTYQPNEYLDTDGKTIIGMDVDLFNAVFAKFGIKADWQTASFDSIILGVNSDKYDAGVSSFTINKDRLTQATMVSYFKAGTQWVTQKGNPKKVDPENACGLNVAAQKGTVQQDDLTARSKKCTEAGKKAINILIDSDQAKVTAMVQSGKADAMAVDLPPAVAAVKLTSGSLELLGDQYDSAPYGIVLPKEGSDQFAQGIVTALKALEADGTYEQILKKWNVEGGAISDFAVNPDVSS